MKNKRYTLAVIVIGLLITFLSTNVYRNNQIMLVSGLGNFLNVSYEVEKNDGTYYTMMDEQKNIITKTALPVHVGDEFWAADNKHYKVIKIKKDIAIATFIGVDNIAWLDEWDEIQAVTNIPTVGEKKGNNKIAVYHTHTDESYVPTDGVESIRGKGGIFKVGDAFTEKLNNLGFEVEHDKTPHDPHDAGAYHRSRRTAVNLLKKQPAIAFDVHRDAVPADVYAKQIGEQKVTQIKLVVGRQNQNKQSNLEFAKTMKAAMDKTNPGLFEGIFLAKGNYNQDLGPRMMLIEVGSHENSREEAEKGVALFADAVPKVLGVYNQKAAAPKQTAKTAKTGAWSGVWWLLGVVLIGGLGFLIISTGSISGSMKKLGEFSGSEWKNYFGERKHNVTESKLNRDAFNLNKVKQEEIQMKSAEFKENNDERADYQKD